MSKDWVTSSLSHTNCKPLLKRRTPAGEIANDLDKYTNTKTCKSFQYEKRVTMFADPELFLEHIYHFMFEWLEFVKDLIKLYLTHHALNIYEFSLMGCRVACRKILNVLKKEISKSKDKRIQTSSVEEICDDLQKMAAQVIQNVQTPSPAKVWYSTEACRLVFYKYR